MPLPSTALLGVLLLLAAAALAAPARRPREGGETDAPVPGHPHLRSDGTAGTGPRPGGPRRPAGTSGPPVPDVPAGVRPHPLPPRGDSRRPR